MTIKAKGDAMGMYPVKSDGQTYDEHIHRCMKAWKEIWLKREKQFMQFASEYNISYPLLRQKSMISVLFHDLGKLTDNFQGLIKAVINKQTVNKELYFRHEIPSAIFLLEYWMARRHSGLDDSLPFEVWAVLGHHKTLDPLWTSFGREKRLKEWPSIPDKRLQYAENLALEYLEPEGLSLLDPVKEIPEAAWKDTFFMVLDKTYAMELQGKKQNTMSYKRQVYSLIKGILHYCDWWASSENVDYSYSSIITNEYVLGQLKQKLNSEGKEFSIRPFQTECAEKKGDLIAIAPTGSGKTEAAVFWANNQGRDRFMILMPTQVTSNSLYKRMQQLVNAKCGLCHSGAQTYFSLHNEEQGSSNFSWLHYKAFMPPVMVATVDQILSSGFNTGLWSHKEFSLLGTAVIIDEIHAYDTYTLGLISETIRKIKSLGGNVMLMSATMPKVLLEHFGRLLGQEYSFIMAEEKMNKARNEWFYLDYEIDELNEHIKKYLQQGKKVAIVVNRIEAAKILYQKWCDEFDCMCYHSEFTMADRIEKEKRIDSVQLLIATQAIEVSLDIDFDIMFSECAPLDCLIQRAGRVNRYGGKLDSKFIVFKASDIAREYVYKHSINLLEKTECLLRIHQGKLTEWDLRLLLEDVYQDYNLYDQHYQDAVKLFESIHTREGIFDLPFKDNIDAKTRLFKYEKISVIPICYYDEVKILVEEKKYEKIALYEVPIGLNKYFKLEKNNRLFENDYRLPIVNVEYSSAYGLDVRKLDEGFLSY